MLVEIAEGVLVRQSAFCQSNAIVVLEGRHALLVDPGVSGRDLVELADDIDALGVDVVAGIATHPHWDHVLWHERFGRDVPRYGSRDCVATSQRTMASMREMTARFAPGAPLDLVGEITPLPNPSGPFLFTEAGVRVVEHRGHAPGHIALAIRDVAVLAGDMLSDVEIPLLDPAATDPCSEYDDALGLLESTVAAGVSILVPGHGGVATGDEAEQRVAVDRAYIAALLAGREPDDARVGPTASYGQEWMVEAHRRNIRLARHE